MTNMYRPNDIILNGTYRIEMVIGKGSFGIVYLATYLKLGILRAIKVVRKNNGLGNEDFAKYRDRFQQEAKLGAEFHHTNIIHIDQFEEIDDELFLIMDYAPNGSLADQINKYRTCKEYISLDQAIKWICEAAEGLQKFHEHDLVHRDIKPSNILLDTENHACIADLGLVQLATSRVGGSSLSGDHPGTAEYMPPEQQPGNKMPLRASADVYALGCVLFELLTLKNYYHHMGIRAKSLRPDIPNWLDEIITRAVQPNLKDRFQNSEEFLQSIQFRNSSSKVDNASQISNTGNKNWVLFSIAGLAVIGIIIFFLINQKPSSGISTSNENYFSQPTVLITPRNTTEISKINVEPSFTPTLMNTSTSLPLVSWKQGEIAYMTSQSSSSTLNIVNLQNSSTQVVVSASDKLGILGLSFSPDGETLAYYAYPKVLNTILVNANSNPKQIATCQSPSFSADGSQILCVSAQKKLILIDSTNGNIIRQISQDKYPGLADLSKSSGEIVYTIFNGGNSQIWKTSLNGEAASLLAGSATENYAPDWSPDGTQIAYQSNDGSSDSEIWIMDNDGNNKQRITYTSNGGWSRAPSWSPDGQYLAYVSSQNGSAGSDLGDIFIVSLIIGDSIQVTSTGGAVYDWRVAWGK